MTTIAPNPLFAREFRARWRDRRAWLLLLALTLGLALLAHTIFSNSNFDSASGAVWTGRNYVQMTASSRAALAGRQLFGALAIGNVVAWLLVAPILAATPIARERERGLLESLQLSHLSPLSQIAARYGAALGFLLVLQGAIAPVYAIVLWLGGVSPAELGRAALLIAATAWSGVALGTWISARAYRPSSALFSALATVILWSIAAFIATAGVGGPPPYDWWYWPATAVFWTHPLVLVFVLTDSSGQIGPLFVPPFGLDVETWVVWCSALWSVASLGLLAASTRAVARQLPPPSWEASAPVEWWRRSLQRRQNSAAETLPPRKRVGRRVEGALVAELPFEKLARFSDPLLAREVQSRFRLRRGGAAVTLGRLLLVGAGVSVWMWAVYALTDRTGRGVGVVVAGVLYFLWVLGAFSVAALSSSSFARERESGTWEGLKLSLLAPLHIARVKWMSPLITFAYYAAPLWILLPFGVNWNAPNNPYTDVGVMSMLLGIGVVACSLGTICILGLVISWRAKAPSAALGWTLGAGALALIIVPVAREVFGFDRWLFGGMAYSSEIRQDSLWALTQYWHPVVALGAVFDRPGLASNDPRWTAFWVQLAIFAGSVGVGLWYLQRQMRRENQRGA